VDGGLQPRWCHEDVARVSGRGPRKSALTTLRWNSTIARREQPCTIAASHAIVRAEFSCSLTVAHRSDVMAQPGSSSTGAPERVRMKSSSRMADAPVEEGDDLDDATVRGQPRDATNSLAIQPQAGVGDLVREWRQRRRLSQLELAGEADISTRHLSFVEIGRATRIENLAEWRAHLLSRLQQQIDRSGDAQLVALHAELSA
jgi:ribosome-binding protein aMBF1 (putative translation factor)